MTYCQRRYQASFALLCLFFLFLPLSTLGKSPVGEQELAPLFDLPTPDGTIVSLSDYRGKPVIINFWASWCAPCLVELPLLDQLNIRLAEKEIPVIALNIDRQRGPALGTQRRLKLNLPVILDPKGIATAVYSPPALPITYIIDSNGRIHSVIEGALNEEQLSTLEQEALLLLKGN